MISIMSKLEEKTASTSNGHISEEEIATLNVVQEEITLPKPKWNKSMHTAILDNDNKMKDFASEQNFEIKRRSETWSGQVCKPVSHQKSFSSEAVLNKETVKRGSVPLNGFLTHNLNHLNRDNEHRRHSFDSNKQNLYHQDSNNTSDISSNENLNNINILKSANEQTLSHSNGEKSCFKIDDLSSEFTDINLQPTNASSDAESENSLKFSPVKQSSRSSIGSLFGWISSPKNSSLESAISSNQNSPSRSKLMSNHSPQQTNHLSDENKSNSQQTSGLKNIKKSLRENIKTKSKGRFWWSKAPEEPLSTTALILENRPSNLPEKSSKEAEKHKIEYEKMVELAKKNELKDILKKRKRLKEQHKQEASISTASSVWLNEILPNWEIMHQSTHTRQLWWQGLPPNVRGKVWQLAIGNELNTTQDLYEIMVTRAHDKLRSIHETQSMGGGEDTESLAADRENTLDLIRLDISRTFPHLCIFQKGGPYHDVLHDILGAYTCYRPDVGYVQGMSFIAAMLLLNLGPADAFVTFTNLLNKPCQVAFFRLDEEKMKAYFASFEVFLEENLPQLFAHFKHHNLTPDMYLIDWIFTMFSKALSLDTACRVWDVFSRDGEEFLFKTAIAILKIHSEQLLGLEFIHAAQCLTRLPSSSFTENKLFETISTISMVSRGNRKWKDVVMLLKKDDAVS